MVALFTKSTWLVLDHTMHQKPPYYCQRNTSKNPYRSRLRPHDMQIMHAHAMLKIYRIYTIPNARMPCKLF